MAATPLSRSGPGKASSSAGNLPESITRTYSSPPRQRDAAATARQRAPPSWSICARHTANPARPQAFQTIQATQPAFETRLAPGGAEAGLARLAEAGGDRRGRLAQPRLGARQLVL